MASPNLQYKDGVVDTVSEVVIDDDDGKALSDPSSWKVWLERNQKQLPRVMIQHLQWVSNRTNQFEEAYFQTPPTMKDIKERLVQGRRKRAKTSAQDDGSTAAMVIRKPTMLPIQNPLREERLKHILSKNIDAENFVVMTEEELDHLCEAVQGYHPGAIKAPLENWLFDSFLSSAEEIIPNLWLGGVVTAHDRKKVIGELNVSRVLCVGGRALAFGQDQYHPPFPDDLAYKVIDVDDTEKTADADALGNCFPEAVSFIEESMTGETNANGSRILVHCMAGASRSASVVCAFLIWKYKMSVEDALKLVRSARPIATPNAAFIVQLERWHGQIIKNNQPLGLD